MKQKNQQESTPPNLDLHALDAVLDAFAAATQDPTTTRDQLYDSFHRRIIACTDSLASAVFSKAHDSQFTMVSHSGWGELEPHSLASVKTSIKQHYLQRPSGPVDSQVATFVSKTPKINGVEYLYVLVRRPLQDALVQNVFADLVGEIANQIESYEVRRSANQKPKAIEDLAHLVQLAQNVGKSRNLTQLAMHLVNDLAKSTGADRVCFFRPSGKLLAVSGVSQASLKTSLAKSLSRIARLAKASNQPIESTDDQVSLGDHRREKIVKQLVNQIDSDILYVSPVESDRQCCGIVSLEYFDRSSLTVEWIDQRNLISQSLSYIAPVVNRAVQVQSIPGIRMLDVVFNHLLTRPARVLLWMISLSSILLAAAYFLLVVERPFEIHAEGVLQPSIRRNIFSPREGEIRELFVVEGSRVTAGQKLVWLESQQLAEQIILVEGELAEATQQLQNLELADLRFELNSQPDDPSAPDRTQTASEIKRLKAKTETLLERQELLQQQVDDLLLVSPIAGQVTTRDVDRRLDSRPVSRGDLLMAVAAMDGEWEIELSLPDNRVEFVEAAVNPLVRFRIAADSESIYEGTIRDVDFRADSTRCHRRTGSPERSLTSTNRASPKTCDSVHG